MTRGHALLVLLCAAGFVSSGCGKPQEGRVARDVRIVRAENAPDRLFEKGKAFHEVGDLTRAEQYYAAALQAGAPAKDVLPLLLRVCVAASRFQVAIDYAEPFLKKDPRDHRLRLVVASLHVAVGDAQGARTHYERVLEARPEDATAHYGLAVLLRDEFQERVLADQHFREYLRLEPNGTHAEEARASLLKPVVAPALLPQPLPQPQAVPQPQQAPSPVLPGGAPTPLPTKPLPAKPASPP